VETAVRIVVTGWNGGGHHSSGAGYGVRMSKKYRDGLVRREWVQVAVDLPDGTVAHANVDGKAFWRNCPELRSKDIGRWMLANGLAPWLKGEPPKFELTVVASARFSLTLLK